MKVLVTGGAGYIGSHTSYQLLKDGHEVTILDNMEKGHESALDIVKQAGEFDFLKSDLRDLVALREVLNGKSFDAVIHFAAYLEVGLSVKQPAIFFENNVVGSQNLFQVLLENGINNVIFSSSAAVYGTQTSNSMISESSPKSPDSPYGETKLLTERILESYCKYTDMNAVALRYFNPAGAAFGLGERHLPETHVIPRVLRAFLDQSFKFGVFGDDYPTPDGSCIRDFIHVEDLVSAHIAAVYNISRGFRAYNVGTGNGTSVFEVIKAAEDVVGKKLTYEISERREGDPAMLVADPKLFTNDSGWKAKHDIHDILESAWEYEQSRPESDYK